MLHIVTKTDIVTFINGSPCT